MADNTVEIRFTAKDLTSSTVKKIGTSFKNVGASVAGLGKHMLSLKGLLAGAGVGLVAKQFLDAADTTEQFNTRLSVLLGSAEEGNKLFKEMTTYAGQVPFEFEEIMQSATQLSGIMEGGVQEIKEWMPLIGDLAATSGLSIQQTTEQVQRMLSAGAASADMFRERGITAMLGFQAGTSYSVEQTREMLMNAWKDPESKFAGATDQLATTWSGLMSMISDKWFALRTMVMDAGVMAYFKAIATTINQYFGQALQDGADNASKWANFVIDAIRSIINAFGWILNIVHAVKIAWIGLKYTFSGIAQGIVENLFMIADGWRQLANIIPGVDIGPMEGLESLVQSMRGQTSALGDELKETFDAGLPGDKVAAFAEAVEMNFTKIKDVVQDTKQVMAGEGGGGFFDWDGFNEATQSGIEENYLKLSEGLLLEREEYNLHYEQQLLDLENAYLMLGLSDAQYREQKERLEEEHQKNIAKTRDRAIKGSYEFGAAMRKKEYLNALEHGVSMLSQAKGLGGAMFKLWQAAALAKAIVSLPSAVIQSYENAGGYPWGIVPAGLMAAAGASQIAQIKGATMSQAHGGLDNVPRDETFLLRAGERVVQPEANRDLTEFLANGGGGGGSVSIENFNLYLPEVTDLRDMDSTELQELIADKIIPALDALAGRGVKQEALTTLEAL